MSSLLDRVKYDRLTPEEIQELTAYDQLVLLNEIGQEIGRLSELASNAIDAKRDAQILAIDFPSPENKKLVLQSSATLQKANLWLKARRDQQRGLQSNLKATH